MPDDDAVEPVHLDDHTILVGDAARKYREAFADRKTVPLRTGDRIIGTAQLQPDGTAMMTVTDSKMQHIFQANLDAVSFGPFPRDTEATLIDPPELENP